MCIRDRFFTANIRNRHTRAAYARAAARFARWCDAHRLALAQLTPVSVAAYIEELGQYLARPSVKQHLAALRMLFDYLVTGQVLPANPAYAVRGPKHVVKTGRTPVLSAEETRALLDHIDVHTILFRSPDRWRRLTERGLHRLEVLAMIKRRARRAGLPETTCCHTFRATGITTYLQNGGTIEHAQQIAAHESPRTTKLYDRTSDAISLDEIERILI